MLQWTLDSMYHFELWFLSYGSYNSSVFSFVRKFHPDMHTGSTYLHSHQQCRRVPFFPHPWNHAPQNGTWSHVLGLEPAKTLIETWPHGVLIRITHLVSGWTEAQVLCFSVQNKFSKRQSDRHEVGLLL